MNTRHKINVMSQVSHSWIISVPSRVIPFTHTSLGCRGRLPDRVKRLSASAFQFSQVSLELIASSRPSPIQLPPH
ncbi:hypothetical protein BO82DRAFT_168450 [Aspergillus uvarum CBS 121591]|uniref:Uncharacterized protein n=1 Tax=Aspergillus uvarum CBS 121591 TaxID=1448315 RepID=A0A319BYX4_9EURO|nr:hypothetical protein BO82DRAFT_168450 [Aspergillus uvarum CBS 121591]PYH77935.1 hypothetical protein BO82DRAFT_168450 [Aspergillus uvarum CBS 121591]